MTTDGAISLITRFVETSLYVAMPLLLVAAVVGILGAALYDPVWTGAILSWRDFALACAAYVLLEFWKWPSWLVVALCAVAAGVGWSSAS